MAVSDRMQKNSMDDSLWGAAERGDLAAVQNLLAKGVPVDALNRKGVSALHMAAKQGHVPVLETLAEAGANIEKPSRAGSTALMFAAFGGHESAAAWLLHRGASIEVRGENDRTALMYAAAHGHTGVARLLIQHGADTTQAILQAAEQSRETMLLCLLDCGVDVNVVDSKGETPLFRAVRSGFLALIERLLAAGADVNHQNAAGKTAIYGTSYPPILCLLLKHGADTDIRYHNGQTLMMWAIEKGVADVVRVLLEQGADVNARDADGNTAFYYALLFQRKVTAEWLRVRGGRDLIPEAVRTQTANLFRAAVDGDVDAARNALDHGAQMDARNLLHNFGFNALTAAADRGHIEVVRLLLDRGAKVNAVGSYQYTPLKWAAWNGHTDVVELLLDRGGKPYEQAIQAAAYKGHAQTVRYLMDRGAPAHTRNPEDSSSPLRSAVEQGHLEVARILLDGGAADSIKAEKRGSLLVAASSRGQTEMARLLLDRGVCPTPAAIKRAFRSAAGYGSAELVTLLLAHGADIKGRNGVRAALDAAMTCNTPVLALLLERGVTFDPKTWQQAIDLADKLDRDVGKLDPIGTKALLQTIHPVPA